MSVLRVGYRLGMLARRMIAVAEAAEHRRRTLAPTEARAVSAEALTEASNELLSLFGLEVQTFGVVPVGPVVLAANHLGYVDPLVVASRVPCVPLAKGEVERWPLLGPRVRDFGVVFLRRGDPLSGATALRRAARALAQGQSVLNFPEGTTTTGPHVKPFRRGIFGVARRFGVPIVPIRIEYPRQLCWVDDETFVPHFWNVCRAAGATIRVRFGAPLLPRRDDDPGALAARVRALVAEPIATTSSPVTKADAITSTAARV